MRCVTVTDCLIDTWNAAAAVRLTCLARVAVLWNRAQKPCSVFQGFQALKEGLECLPNDVQDVCSRAFSQVTLQLERYQVMRRFENSSRACPIQLRC